MLVLMVVSGGLIGWVTNYLAIKLLFRPYKRFFYLQGLIPKRRYEIIENIAESIKENLLNLNDIKSIIENSNLIDYINFFISDKLKENKVLSFLPESIFEKTDKYIKKVILNNKDEITKAVLNSIEHNLDIKVVIKKRLEKFSNKELENLIIKATQKELKHIEILGGILGAAIGLIQFFISNLIN